MRMRRNDGTNAMSCNIHGLRRYARENTGGDNLRRPGAKDVIYILCLIGLGVVNRVDLWNTTATRLAPGHLCSL
jgi:hypothetical protein